MPITNDDEYHQRHHYTYGSAGAEKEAEGTMPTAEDIYDVIKYGLLFDGDA